MYFTTNGKVNYYDCDCNNQLKLSSAMKYMQQTSSEQLEYLGFPVDKLYAEQMAFLLSKMCVKVHRLPVCGEGFAVGTAPVQPRGARFVREFVLDSLAGERLLSAFSLWILVNPATRKILRPASFPYALIFEEEQLGDVIQDVAFPKEQGRGLAALQVPIRYSHIDVNRHVNNTVYADFVCDALPFERLQQSEIESLAIGFQNEAKIGETVVISTDELSDVEYHMTGLHSGSPCFEALVRLRSTI